MTTPRYQISLTNSTTTVPDISAYIVFGYDTLWRKGRHLYNSFYVQQSHSHNSIHTFFRFGSFSYSGKHFGWSSRSVPSAILLANECKFLNFYIALKGRLAKNLPRNRQTGITLNFKRTIKSVQKGQLHDMVYKQLLSEPVVLFNFILLFYVALLRTQHLYCYR